MTPEQSMRIYLTECALHAEVLVEGLRDAYSWMPLSADRLADKTLLRIFGSNRLSIYKIARFDGRENFTLDCGFGAGAYSFQCDVCREIEQTGATWGNTFGRRMEKLRVARNAITQEYPDDPKMRLIAIKRFLDGPANLSLLYRSVTEYIMVHFPGLSAGNDLNGKRE